MIAVDAGNTLIKVVVFRDSGSVDGLKTWPAAAYEECLNWLKEQSDSIWIADSSARVWPLGKQVSTASNWGFDLEYSAQIGLDRLASMRGAIHRHPQSAVLMVSLGTCLTYSYLNQSGTFQGGAIAPGWAVRLKAMHHYTQSLLALPIDNLTPPADWTPSDPRTSSSAQSMMRGAFQGMIDEIDAEVERFSAINSDLIVIIHGGDAPSFVNHLKRGIFANENWTALGLWAMSQN
ncbi:MAG: type III pantothenate kinase [Flavobacteriaceae bacterium]|nr:type III pantothenate kinase [Flavobacteriaceae bacterium]PHX84400.1 MAG: hypothetical protein CK537_00790 [Flavobacteriales bacterium]